MWAVREPASEKQITRRFFLVDKRIGLEVKNHASFLNRFKTL
jgi:hypothetical protein